MSDKKIALLAGATGLIGNYVLKELISSNQYTKVIVLSRKSLSITSDKVQEIITDLNTLQQHAAELKADDVFCCLGTTMAKAGSKEKFYEVDFTYPYELARISKQNGARQYLIITAMGAKKSSWIYYNQVKGKIEEAIKKLGFECTHVLRPSLLLGPRQEKRAGEDAAKNIYRYLNPLIPANYKGIEGKKVARAMLYYAEQNQQGFFIHESKYFHKF